MKDKSISLKYEKVKDKVANCHLAVLLNLHNEAIIREAFDDLKEEIKIGAKLIIEIRFTDYKAGVLASTRKDYNN